MALLITYLLISVLLGYFIGKQAERHDRSMWAYIALSVLLSPIISWLILIATTPRE
ncbi:MAG: hypothetical protein K9L68_03600 [Spirochaetales bacterium]|nr:hypothetical protein [Spirochaetales bacterium]